MRDVKSRLIVTTVSLLILLFVGFFLCSISSCNPVEAPTKNLSISESEITAFQQSFGVSLNSISNAIANKGDVEVAAKNHIEKYYGFDDGKVIFKADRSDESPFRNTYEGVLSYLIGNNVAYPDDKGAVLPDWRKVNWKNAGIINDGDVAIAMGQSVFVNEGREVQKQNYTMAFKKNKNGKLKLIAHKTSMPCDN